MLEPLGLLVGEAVCVWDPVTDVVPVAEGVTDRVSVTVGVRELDAVGDCDAVPEGEPVGLRDCVCVPVALGVRVALCERDPVWVELCERVALAEGVCEGEREAVVESVCEIVAVWEAL